MWTLLIILMSPQGDILEQTPWRVYADQWQCEQVALRIYRERKNPLRAPVCVMTEKLPR